jgi:sec-independent protein translocase protein TatB
MIPDIGWIELLVIASLAIIVVGPKDLPKLMRTLGNWVGKARAMAREFQKSFDDIAREAELDELRAQVDALKQANPVEHVKHALDPGDELVDLDKELKKFAKEEAADKPDEVAP